MLEIVELRGIAMILASSLPGLLLGVAAVALSERRRSPRRNAAVRDE